MDCERILYWGYEPKVTEQVLAFPAEITSMAGEIGGPMPFPPFSTMVVDTS